jgi:protein-S-isoprenylcysteine O-methyltransferase Ste14
MSRILAFLYGVVVYAFFLPTFLYAIGFVSGFYVPKDINAGPTAGLVESVAVDLALMSLFAVQHSVMARPGFKRWWTQFVPKSVERSTYVLLASAILALLIWQWRPLPAVVWQVDGETGRAVVLGLMAAGWATVFLSTFLINHFELFGLRQVVVNLSGRSLPAPEFRTPMLYRFVRHPLYLGFIVAFWAAPTMTAGRLLFAAVTTAYIFVGIALEERDLIAEFGDQYREYRERVSMLLPWRRSA